MKRDIAVIGISGKFPKSTNVQEFWKNLVDEKELVHFFTDEELRSRGIDAKQLNDSSYIKAASFIDTYNTFDYSFFKYTPDEAKLMNPQTRLMHQLVWEGVEDAGLNLETYNKKAGIFLGANRDLNWNVYASLAEAGSVDAMTKAKITNPNFMASLIAYKLNLRGPCYFIDTACSTSLSTAHLACRSLLLNECGTAIVGGVRLLSHHDNGYLYEPGTIVSEDGSVRSFDASSSGTIFCDGAGVVILKKLEEAIKDSDHVYAVIKASAMNNDGSSKGGYTMPSVSGQSECIKLAHKIAGVQPTDITYVEAHGTATKIGDPIEIESLNKAFNNDTSHKCAIGTVKSNVGHADEAAGILGLIKTTLSLKNKTIPASLHYKKANPSINFAGGPFYVNTKTTAWNRLNNKPLTAGISSFGIGGTNIHMVLQETPVGLQKMATPEASYQIRYSADSISALQNFEKTLLKFVQENPTVNLGALAYTLQVGRKQFALWKSFEVKNRAELIEKLTDKSIIAKEVKEKQDLVFMFSGQGSQYVGMGKFLYEHFTSFKETMDNGFELLKTINGIDYKAILFDTTDSQKINETKYTQPILFLFEYALAKLFIEFGSQPNAMIGHSLGEYVAATISEVFTLEDALRILCKRADLMYTVAKGSMLSISANKATLDKELFSNVSIATINSPNSFVVSGTDEAIHALTNVLVEKDIQHVVLKTSHAFHSTMMEPIVAEFETALQTINLQAPTIPFVSNNSGTYITNEEATSASYWAKHIINTVDFKKGIEFLQQQNNGLFLEIGPGRTLTTFFNQCNTTGDKNVAINTIKHPKETTNERTHFLNLLGQIWQHKFDIDWNTFYQGNIPTKISLPTYCFDTYDFPTKVSIDEQLKSQNITLGTDKQEGTLQVATWKPATKLFKTPENLADKTYVIFCDENAVNNELIALWKLNEIQVITVTNNSEFKQLSETQYEINPTEKSSFEQLKQAFSTANITFDKIIFSWKNKASELTFEHDTFDAYNNQFTPVLEFMRTFEINTLENDCHIVLLTDSNVQVTGVDTIKGTNNHTSILLRVLVQEASHIQASHIDVDFDKKVDIDQLHAEIHHTADYYKVAYRNKKRWIPTYESLQTEIEVSETPFATEGVYVVTGELGTIEFELIKYLKETHESNFFLIGKNVNEEQYAEKIATLQAGSKGSFAVAEGDVSDLTSLTSIVTNIEAEFGKINGIIHAARFQSREHFLVSSTTKNSIHNHFSVKVNGLLNLYKVFKNKELDFVKVFSSLSAKLGGVTFGAYATSNALLDEVAIGLFTEKTQVSVFNFDKLGTEDTQISVTDIIENFEKSFAFKNEEQLIISRRNLNQFEDRASLSEDKQEARFEINRTQLDTEFTAATTPTEERIVALFEDLFGQTGIGTEDNFFALGGDSLKGISLVNKINKEFSIKLTLTDFFNNATVHELASLIDNRKWLAEKPTTKNEIFI